MAMAIPIEVFELLEKKVGREEAKEIIEVIDAALQTIEKRAEAVALEKKLEVKDELTRELATKADIAELGGEIKLVRQEMQTMRVELDRRFTILFVILFFTVVFLNQNALEFLARVLRLIP